MTENGEDTDDLQMVEVFNEYFTSLFAGSTAVNDRNLRKVTQAFSFVNLMLKIL